MAMRVWPGMGILLLTVCLLLPTTGFQPAAPPTGDYEYVGTKTCKKCHFECWQSWSQTKMANSLLVLRPDSELKPDKKLGVTAEWIAEIKQSKGKGDPKIEAEKDYTRQAECLKCHTTGFGQKGGYAMADEKDKKAARKNEDLKGVGCESCHGPGSKYVEIFKDIQDKQRPYTRAELYAAGMTKISVETCAKCHNKESPLVDDKYVFDFEKRKDEGTHKHIELKLRKE